MRILRVFFYILGCVGLVLGLVACDSQGTCPQTCSPGQRVCQNGHVAQCEANVTNGCYYWALSICAQGCDQSTGLATCKGNGPPNGQCNQLQHRRGCVGNDVYWFDNCNKARTKISTCPPGATCQATTGTCVTSNCPNPCAQGTVRCNGEGIEQCKVTQPGGCPSWVRYSACSKPYTCEKGRCVKQDQGCQDQCQDGQRLCTNGGITRCDRGTDGCLRWSPAIPCPAGQKCQNNQCVPDQPQPQAFACCINQACQTLTATACQQQGGKSHPNQQCSAVNCQPPAPTAACCRGSSCAMLTQQACQQDSGTFHANKTCNDKPCDSSSSGSCGSKGSGGSLQSRKDWPCTGCYMAVPSGYNASKPTPLVVALHGDEGRADYIYQVFKPSVTAEGWLLVSLRCPRNKGCNGSWWRWRDQSGNHDPNWVNSMVDQVEKSYNIDRKRVYLTGWSGGSSYNSSHATTHANRYAAVNYNSGGHSFRNCPACKIPAYYYIGSRDFLLNSARKGEAKYKSCGGHNVTFDLLQGVDHQGISRRLSGGGAAKIVQWFKANPHKCLKCGP